MFLSMENVAKAIGRKARHIQVLAVLAATLPMTGCAAIGYVANVMAPPPKVKAVYELPQEQRVLIFPDDKVTPLGYPPLKRLLAESINKHFMDEELAAEVVPYDELLNLSTTADFDRLAIDRVGSKLGADLVVYIDIEEFRLKSDPAEPFWNGRLAVRVRVVDVRANAPERRLWPKDDQRGMELSIETPTLTDDSRTYGPVLAEQMASRMADKLAKLFYEHKGRSLSEPEPEWE